MLPKQNTFLRRVAGFEALNAPELRVVLCCTQDASSLTSYSGRSSSLTSYSGPFTAFFDSCHT